MIATEHEGGPRSSRRSRAASPAAGMDRTPSIRARLVLLVLALLIPALLLTGLLLWSLERQVNRMQERQLAATARALALVVDGRIGEQVATLQALAVSRPLAQGDWGAFANEARTALNGTSSWVVVRFPNGDLKVNTFAGPGEATPASPTRIPAAAWSGSRGPAQISNVIWGPVSKQPVVVVMKPVVLNDGRAANLSVVTTAASFSKLLARQQLPARWTATILDGQQRVVGRSREGQKFVGYRHPAQVMKSLAAQNRHVLRTVTLDGIAGITAYDQLPSYHWVAVVAMPRDEAVGAVQQALLLVVVLGALLLTAAVLLALRMGRRIAQPVETVARAASEWVAGGAANFPTSTGLSETDGLSRAFASALEAVEQRDTRQKLLMNELNHRVKNTLATVQAVALHTRAGAASTEDYHAALEGRVIAMSRAHEILTRTAWEGAELGDLARDTLSAFAGPQLKIHGPSAPLSPTDALNLALVLYELATNASKHGALSTSEGAVELSWRNLGGETHVSWRETGGPPVVPPTRKGFGSRLIGRATRDLKPSKLEFAADGVRCDFTVRTHGGA
ncbi:sensor histidine kinase [Phenylobacterium sp. LjRoot225]|uniref:sensor histidine kinase n=1 Tax=Phenylobacterium sp. LjRoot225 TaxID=3342285 RepID=UPI003ECF595F